MVLGFYIRETIEDFDIEVSKFLIGNILVLTGLSNTLSCFLFGFTVGDISVLHGLGSGPTGAILYSQLL